jgi:hypothetical protein
MFVLLLGLWPYLDMDGAAVILEAYAATCEGGYTDCPAYFTVSSPDIEASKKKVCARIYLESLT